VITPPGLCPGGVLVLSETAFSRVYILIKFTVGIILSRMVVENIVNGFLNTWRSFWGVILWNE